MTKKQERKTRLSSGAGVRILTTRFGRTISFRKTPQSFIHPWMVSLNGSTAMIEPGTINGVEMTINKIPLSGDKKNPPPEFKLPSPIKFDMGGRGWICAEITCDPKQDFAIIKVEPVQVASLDGESGDLEKGAATSAAGGVIPLKGNKARFPLAMLRDRGATTDIFQITFFGLRHRVQLKADGKTPSRHFFW